MRDVTFTFTLQLLPKFPVSEYKLIEMNEEPTWDENDTKEVWGPEATIGGCGNQGCNSYIEACAFAPDGGKPIAVTGQYDSAYAVGYGTWQGIRPMGDGFCQTFHQQSHNTPRNVKIKISYHPADKHLMSNPVKLQEVDAGDVPVTQLAYGRIYVAYFNNKQQSYRLRLTMFTGEPWEATPELQVPQTDALKIRKSDKSANKELSLIIETDWYLK